MKLRLCGDVGQNLLRALALGDAARFGVDDTVLHRQPLATDAVHVVPQIDDGSLCDRRRDTHLRRRSLRGASGEGVPRVLLRGCESWRISVEQVVEGLLGGRQRRGCGTEEVVCELLGRRQRRCLLSERRGRRRSLRRICSEDIGRVVHVSVEDGGSGVGEKSESRWRLLGWLCAHVEEGVEGRRDCSDRLGCECSIVQIDALGEAGQQVAQLHLGVGVAHPTLLLPTTGHDEVLDLVGGLSASSCEEVGEAVQHVVEVFGLVLAIGRGELGHEGEQRVAILGCREDSLVRGEEGDGTSGLVEAVRVAGPVPHVVQHATVVVDTPLEVALVGVRLGGGRHDGGGGGDSVEGSHFWVARECLAVEKVFE